MVDSGAPALSSKACTWLHSETGMMMMTLDYSPEKQKKQSTCEVRSTLKKKTTCEVWSTPEHLHCHQKHAPGCIQRLAWWWQLQMTLQKNRKTINLWGAVDSGKNRKNNQPM